MEKFKMNLQMFNDAEFVGLLSQGSVLQYRLNESAQFITVAGVRSMPEVGTTPEGVDATDLSSNQTQNIAGLESSENLEFGIKYKASRFAEFYALSRTRQQIQCRVVYPDGGGYDFTGQIFVRMGAAEVNGLLEGTLTVIVSQGPEFVEEIAMP